jgi:hypothetical protein
MWHPHHSTGCEAHACQTCCDLAPGTILQQAESTTIQDINNTHLCVNPKVQQHNWLRPVQA